MAEAEFVPYLDRHAPAGAPEAEARRFCEIMAKRRSVRMFSDRPVSEETIAWIVRAAGTAPSGANKQPWRFVCVRDPDLKRRIRAAAEEEERAFYRHRAPPEWLADLAPLGTDDVKAYLEVAPWLIVVFRLTHTDGGGQVYYGHESVGIATGLLLAAAHFAGLATLTHTPNPMGFLASVLGRPAHEKPYVLIPIGWPADGCRVPAEALRKKPLEEIMIVDRGGHP